MRSWLVGAVLIVAACGPSEMDGATNEGEGATQGVDTASVARSKAENEQELMRLEREFSAASGREGASAWSSRWAPNGRIYGGGAEHVGPAAVDSVIGPVIAEYGDRFTWWPDTAVVAASGDLGYTLGSYAIVGEGEQASDTIARGNYVTVWQKQQDGSWKIAVDIGT